MRLYHGSHVEVRKPDVSHSRNRLDFGKGFYLTSIAEQANEWALAKAKIHHLNHGIVSMFKVESHKSLVSTCSVFELLYYNEEWFDYVIKCRTMGYTDVFDIVFGRVADAKLNQLLPEIKAKKYTVNQALNFMKMHNTNDQYCFRTNKICDSKLTFIGSYDYYPNGRKVGRPL